MRGTAARRAERDALRRRLYGPDASDGDRAAYAAVAPDRSRPAARLLIAVALAAAIALAAVLAVSSQRPGGPAEATVPLSAADRAELVDGLASGGYAGIAAVLVTHPSPPALRSATRFTTIERFGRGDAELRLAPEGVPAGAGRATVLLVLEQPGRAGWALRHGSGRLAAETGSDRAAGALSTTTIRYRAGDRPSTLRIDVDGDARWGAAVVYSD